jgi:hypothetical protein
MSAISQEVTKGTEFNRRNEVNGDERSLLGFRFLKRRLLRLCLRLLRSFVVNPLTPCPPLSCERARDELDRIGDARTGDHRELLVDEVDTAVADGRDRR